jgi:hypothetical protein
MDHRNATLDGLLAADLPSGFVCALLDLTPNLYRDAYAAVYENPVFGIPEADYMLGHERRARFEAMLRDVAVKHGLKVAMERSKDEDDREHGCQHVRVFAGRFTFTACHVSSPGGFPRYSRTREQYSLINEHASQGQLFPVVSDPKKSDLYGVIVHTETRRKKEELQSIAIGFPNHEFNAWIQEPIDFRYITAIQQGMFQKPEDLQAAIQNNEPEWKHRESRHGISEKE